MKKIIITTLVLGLTSAWLMAEAPVAVDKNVTNMKEHHEGMMKHKAKAPHPKMAELVDLPHLKRFLGKHKETLALTKEQGEAIKTKIFKTLRKKIHAQIEEAGKLEQTIIEAVMVEQKRKEDVKADLDSLIEMKRVITDGHIDALNTLGSILTKEQYVQVLELLKKK